MCLIVLPLEALELHHGVVELERATAPAPGHPPPLLCLGLLLSVTIHLISLLLTMTMHLMSLLLSVTIHLMSLLLTSGL